MSGCMQAVHGAGGFNPRSSSGNIVISHSTALGNADNFVLFSLEPSSQWGSAEKTEGFTSTNLTASIAQWAGQRYIFAAGMKAGFQFEARLTVNSGSSPNVSGSDPEGVWIPLGGGHFWGLERFPVGTTSASWTVEIRSAASLQVISLIGISPSITII